MATIAEFTAIQEEMKTKMILVNENILRIKTSLGKAILKQIVNSSLTAMSIPYEFGTEGIYTALGVFGGGLLLLERIRLRPYLAQLAILQDQYNESGKKFAVALAEQAGKITAVKLELDQSGYDLDENTGLVTPKPNNTLGTVTKLDTITESTGIPQLLRDNNINPQFAYAVYPVGAFVGYKIYKKYSGTKRKKAKR
jgi:hypothetical protein